MWTGEVSYGLGVVGMDPFQGGGQAQGGKRGDVPVSGVSGEFSEPVIWEAQWDSRCPSAVAEILWRDGRTVRIGAEFMIWQWLDSRPWGRW